MSTDDQTSNKPRAQRSARRAPTVPAPPSNQVKLPGTVGSTKPRRAIALLDGWTENGDADEDRRAYEALVEEIERLRA